MIISELIKSLQAAKEKHGDLSVCYYNDTLSCTIDIEKIYSYPKNRKYKDMYNTRHDKWIMLI